MKPASALVRDALSAEVPRAIVAAWVIAALTVPYSFAVSSIIFGGPLLPFVTASAGLMMFGSIMLCLLSAWTSSYRGVVANPHEIPAAVLGSVGAAVAASMAHVLPAHAAFMTMVALLILSSVTTGLMFLAIGHFRRADLFRLVPYPLMGGFFAGTGWVVTLVGLVMNANALEVATSEEVDLDREFRVAGLSGVVAGAGGSAPGYVTFVLSLASRKMGATTPWTETFTALWLCLTLLLGSTALEFLPNAVIGGIVLFIGVDLLFNWLVEVRNRLHWADYGTVVLIAFTIAAFGFLEGIAVSFLAALILFATRMARMDPIESSLTGESLRSHKVHSVPERAILVKEADRIRIFRLRGYLFFGSAYRLMLALRRQQDDAPPPSFVVLDCTSVLGFDVSAIHVLAKYLRALPENAVEVVICMRSARLKSNVARSLAREVRDRIRFEADLDHALERCEDSRARLDGAVRGSANERGFQYELGWL